MKKSVYWWISLLIACVFGGFMSFYLKEWPQFLFAVFLLVAYGVSCSLDADEKIKT